MTMVQPGEFIQDIIDKGWNLYFRGTFDYKLSDRETIEKGRVDSLENNVLYVLMPQVTDPKNKEQIDEFYNRHTVKPSFTTPKDGPRFKGWRVHDLGKGNSVQDPIHPEEHIEFYGFEIQDDKIRLLCQTETYMPSDQFKEGLKTLTDISDLVNP